MKHLISTFPAAVRLNIATIIDNGGILTADECEQICNQLSISLESLMVSLLPIAASYSKSALSSYKVGAVALGLETNKKGYSNLYLGANLEFQTLYFSVHAEQSAVSNAWLDGQRGIKAIAVTAAPCGHCRQFLKEIAGDRPLKIILPATEPSDLSQLLPAAFGPLDLGCEFLMMQETVSLNQLELVSSTNSTVVNLALEAARLSYAPYSLNYAGCALEVTTGEIFSGRYAENAAHNPSLSPFSSALSKTILNIPAFEYKNIKRLILVECPTKVSQKEVTENLLASCNADIKLEYHLAVLNT